MIISKIPFLLLLICFCNFQGKLLVIQGLKSETRTELLKHFEEATESLKEIKAGSLFPEEINSKLNNLIKNYDSTCKLIESDSLGDEFLELLHEGSNIHLELLDVIRCYTSLYSVRRYITFSETSSARYNLQEMWDEFMFEDGFEIPADKMELYSIWARNFFEGKGFENQIKELIDNNNFSNECNLKWWRFIIKYYSTEEETGLVPASSFYII